SGFYPTLHKQIVTMEAQKNGITTGSKMLYDMAVIFAQIFVIGQLRHIIMRKSAKSAIIERLGVYTSESRMPKVVIADGGALLYHMVWTHGGTI
ncbi:hypothetical protein LSAT2_026175, partial [Lamellibrachia satsuma]